MGTLPTPAARLGALGVLLACVVTSAWTPQSRRDSKKSPPLIEVFHGSYDEARTRAVERNVPLIAIVIVEERGKSLDSDIAEFRDSLFATPEFAVAAQHAVVVMASNTAHDAAAIEVVEQGEKSTRQVCSVYRTSNCQTHQKLFDSIYAEHNVEGELRNPNVIVFGVDRAIHQRWNDGHAPEWEDVVGALGEVRKKAGEGLTEAQFAQIRALLPQAAEFEKNARWGSSFTTWGKVLAITRETRYAEQAKQGQAKSNAELEKSRAQANAWLDEDGRAVDGYKLLLELQRDWQGSGREKELARDVAAAERHKTAKDAIAAYKRELEAEQLWSEALELLGKDDTRPAHAKLRQILRKYEGTPAEKRVRERFPDIAAEEDAKQPR